MLRRKAIRTALKWVLVILIVICFIQFLRSCFLVPALIQRVEFRGYDSCDSPAPQKVELTRGEIWQLAACYNLSVYAGRVNAEGCPSDYGFTIYLAGGTKISAREANSPRVEVNPASGQKFWIKSSLLDQYAQKLMEKYDLADP